MFCIEIMYHFSRNDVFHKNKAPAASLDHGEKKLSLTRGWDKNKNKKNKNKKNKNKNKNKNNNKNKNRNKNKNNNNNNNNKQ